VKDCARVNVRLARLIVRGRRGRILADSHPANFTISAEQSSSVLDPDAILSSRVFSRVYYSVEVGVEDDYPLASALASTSDSTVDAWVVQPDRTFHRYQFTLPGDMAPTPEWRPVDARADLFSETFGMLNIQAVLTSLTVYPSRLDVMIARTTSTREQFPVLASNT